MVPTNQRLKTHQAYVIEINEWLVIKLEFISLYGESEIGLKFEQSDSPCVHYLVKDDMALVGLFGVVHRDVCIAKQLVGVFVSGSSQCDPNAYAGKDLPSLKFKNKLHFSGHQIGKVFSFSLIFYTLEKNGELVAAKSPDPASISRKIRKPLSYIKDQSIPHRVSEAVIDGLKAVEVQKKECEWGRSLIGLGSYGWLEKLDELISIRESSKCVMIRGVAKLFAALS